MWSARARAAVLGAGLAMAVASAGGAERAAGKAIVVKAQRAYTMTGAPLDGVTILIVDGKISALGPDIDVPDDAREYVFREGVVTPGLIDANCVIDPEIAEQSTIAGFYCPLCQAAHERHALTSDDRADRCAVCQQAHAHHPPVDGRRQPSLFGGVARALAASEHGEEGHTCSPACSGPQSAADVDTLLASGPSASLTWAEHSSEVVPHRLVIDSVNLLSSDFKRLARGGVTTVYVAPDSASVIGERGAIVKTAGPLKQRIVRRADAVKASMGSDPSSRGRGNNLPPAYGPAPTVFTRRPTTRMGVDFVFRKAFYDARLAAAGKPLRGADQPPLGAVPALNEIATGKIPLRIQARMQHDIFSALRLAKEFGLKFTLEEATEAYQCLPELKAAGVPIIYGPIYDTPAGFRAFTGEAEDARLATPRALYENGIRFALSAQEFRDEDGLVRQGAYAARYGLPADEALRAMTVVPAELLGLSGEVGVLSPRAAGDLVVWSGEPLMAESRPLLVMIDGRVVWKE